MLNLSIGPVRASDEICEIGYEQVPYFRTPEFSAVMKENEVLIKDIIGASKEARAVFLTSSGSGAMEAAVANSLDSHDKALVVNGGSFGQRFVDLCRIYRIPFEEIKLQPGRKLTADMLNPFENKGFTSFLVTIHETATGVLYDADLIQDFCQRNNMFLIVDAISSFLADRFHMENMGADIVIASSHKALACAPGISILILSPLALERVARSKTPCMYFNLQSALKNAERGQTPFTPAVSVLRQLHVRMKGIIAAGGAETEVAKTAAQANDFRVKIKNLPLVIFSESLSNAATCLHPLHVSAKGICDTLRERYKIWVCPNGGDLENVVFRVGHIGALSPEDNTQLVQAFTQMQAQGQL